MPISEEVKIMREINKSLINIAKSLDKIAKQGATPATSGKITHIEEIAPSREDVRGYEECGEKHPHDWSIHCVLRKGHRMARHRGSFEGEMDGAFWPATKCRSMYQYDLPCELAEGHNGDHGKDI